MRSTNLTNGVYIKIHSLRRAYLQRSRYVHVILVYRQARLQNTSSNLFALS